MKMRGNLAFKWKRALTLADIEQLFNHYETGHHDDTLFLTITLTGFHALLQLGEMTQPDSMPKRSSKKVSQRYSLRLHRVNFTYLLPYHKGDRFFEGNVILITSRPTTRMCPHRMMCRYLVSRDAKFSLLPELWLTSNGRVPTYSWYISRLHAVLGAEVAGHSLRSGGATTLALEGVSDDHIQAAGRWASDTFRIYIRKHPILLNALIHGRLHV